MGRPFIVVVPRGEEAELSGRGVAQLWAGLGGSGTRATGVMLVCLCKRQPLVAFPQDSHGATDQDGTRGLVLLATARAG